MVLFDFFESAELPNPQVHPDQAAAIADQVFGVTGPVRELGSQQDRNFLISSGADRFVLKIANPVFHPQELAAQHAAMRLAGQGGIEVPLVVPAADGPELAWVDVGGERLIARLLTYLAGEQLAEVAYVSPAAVAELGAISARMCQALADFSHPGLDRVLQWDLRHAARVVDLLLPFVADAGHARQVRLATTAAQERLRRLAGDLPEQAIHGDLTEDNVVCRRCDDGRLIPAGVIDFGDLARSWRIADLAVGCQSLLHHAPRDPMIVAPAVAAFHQITPLTRNEIEAFWPLVVQRAATLVVSGEQQASLSPDNGYVAGARARDWACFSCATSVPAEVMTEALLHLLRWPAGGPGAAGSGAPRRTAGALLPSISPRNMVLIDLSVTSASLDGGRWHDADAEADLAARAATAPAQAAVDSERAAANSERVAVARYGEYRITRSQPESAVAPETCALHVEVFLPGPVPVHAPHRGVAEVRGDAISVRADDGTTLHLDGVRPDLVSGSAPVSGGAAVSGRTLDSGQRIGTAGPGRLRVQLCTVEGVSPPAFAGPALAPGWLAVCPDPSGLLGLDAAARPADPRGLLARRGASFAHVQEHYYADPPQIEAGWRHHLADVTARSYLDMINNVTILGHGHPRLAEAVGRQWARLNTNSRFHYAQLAEFTERLAGLAPAGLDTVYLVNSGSEANDLALRLACIHTGRRDIVCVREAYHGWSRATDEVSTSTADNPLALETRPDWVHVLRTPNTYRGDFRGPDAARRYARDAAGVIEGLRRDGTGIAAFIAEAYYGNAGGMPLPDGYLTSVYQAIRSAGGLCIADEVQVGYGRLGEHFWGFEQQQVVPDIITVAKGMGNGHPLGAVITRRDIADSFAQEGYFFSSTGASPVSCQVGNTVLDVLADEKLQENARTVGAHLRRRLEELRSRHEIIGAVHGTGLYMGVELVRDRSMLEPATAETAAICDRLLELGVIVQPTADRMNVLKIKPPLCLTAASADFFTDMLDEALSHGW